MEQISAEIVDKTIVWLESLEKEEEMEALIDGFGDEQPLLLAYLMSMGEGDLNEDERELLLFLGTFFWKVFKDAGHEVGEISEEKLEAISTSNIRLLEEAESEQGKNYEAVWESEIEGHPQPELIALLLENLEEEEGYA
ncbi:MAG: hypothetical protein AAF696_30160, partial [Bacteroidota bacterium]